MKKFGIIALVLILVFSLAACRMGRQEEETTVPTDPVTTVPETRPTEPPTTVPDPTLGTNIPDEDVDDDHMGDLTEGGSDTDETQPDLRRRMVPRK